MNKLLLSVGMLISVGSLGAQDRAWWDTMPAPQRQNVQWTRQSVYVPMRDGVRLAVDLYLPNGAGAGNKVATMLHQTRYRRGLQFKDPNREANAGPPAGSIAFVHAGYAVVVVDGRGTGASFGSREVEFSKDEVLDGWDILEWIVAQPWSNGSVGSDGISYPGTTSELVGTLGHPALKAVAPQFSIYDFYPDVIRPGGIFLEPFIGSWAALVKQMDANTFDPSGGPVTGVRPVDGPDGDRLLAEAIAEHANNASIFEQAAAMVTRDDVHTDGLSLDQISPHTLYGTLSRRIPIYNYGGWADGFSNSQIKRFLDQPSPGSRLIMGPWNHGGRWAYYPGSAPVRSQFNRIGELLRFFDYHVRGIETGIEREPPVWYYTTGSNEWKSAEKWPVATTNRQFYLTSDNKLSDEWPDKEPNSMGAYETTSMPVVFDSTVQLGTGNQSRWNTILGGGAVAYQPLEIGNKGHGWISFTSSPLKADLTITGAPVLNMTGSTDSPNASLFVYLEDLAPNGQGSMVTEGQLNLAHRANSEAPAWYPAPSAYHSFNNQDMIDDSRGALNIQAAIELLPTSHTFKAGQRIRLVVRSADRDHFAPTTESSQVGIWAGGRDVHLDLPVE